VVATRRSLLAAAGAGALAAAGCGAPEEPPPDAELLAPALAAALALADAYDALGARKLAAREREHAQRLRAAGAHAGAPKPAAKASGLEGALELERAAMRANLDAAGLVRDLDTRALTAALLSDDAQHESALLARLKRNPIPTAFPDGRAV
jgi:hypothetical protein